MKRVLCILLMVLVLLGCCSCGKMTDNTNDDAPVESPDKNDNGKPGHNNGNNGNNGNNNGNNGNNDGNNNGNGDVRPSPSPDLPNLSPENSPSPLLPNITPSDLLEGIEK
jgi:hypothetical protein